MSKLLYQSDKREHFAEATVNNPNHAAYLYFCPYQKPPVAIVFPPQEIFYTNCIDTVLSSFSGKHIGYRIFKFCINDLFFRKLCARIIASQNFLIAIALLCIIIGAVLTQANAVSIPIGREGNLVAINGPANQR